MGLFKKRDKIVDWSEGYRVSVRKIPVKTVSTNNDSDNSALGFLGSMAESSSSTTDDFSWDNDNQSSSSGESVGEFQEKKQKLARRLLDMTNRIEDMSNQIYHLKQRIELLEKKMKVSYN